MSLLRLRKIAGVSRVCGRKGQVCREDGDREAGLGQHDHTGRRSPRRPHVRPPCTTRSWLSLRSLHMVHDDIKDKEYEMELSWIGPETKFQHRMVPRELIDSAVANAKATLHAEEMDED